MRYYIYIVDKNWPGSWIFHQIAIKNTIKRQLINLKMQQKSVLKRTLPESLKLAVAKKIENNLFSRVKTTFSNSPWHPYGAFQSLLLYCMSACRYPFSLEWGQLVVFEPCFQLRYILYLSVSCKLNAVFPYHNQERMSGQCVV